MQAATWYQRAAELGNTEGMSSLAVMLENGAGLPQDYAQAAVREAGEETKLPVIGTPRWVWSRERVMSWRGKDVLHRERFFLARTDRSEIDTSGLDEKERSWTLGHRWWTADEIATSAERFEPFELGALLQALLRGGPPVEPLALTRP